MAKTKEELREVRKQWFVPMEQKLKEMHTRMIVYSTITPQRIGLFCRMLCSGQ